MKSPSCVAVLALLLASVAASESDDHQRLIEALLRYGAQHGGPQLLPALKHSRVGDIATTADGDVVIDKYSFMLQSPKQNVDGVLSNVTVTNLSSLKLHSNGKSLRVGVDVTIEGKYSIYGTSNEATVEGQGGFGIQMTGLESEGSVNYTLMDETKLALESVEVKLSVPSIKVTFENFILDTGAAKFLNDLLRH